jgi:hypothetical protein
MVYPIRINKRIRNIRVYTIKKRLGRGEGLMTKLFIRLFNQGKKDGRAALRQKG